MLILTDSNFETEVIKATTPVFVDFWAPWCIEPSAYVLTGSNEWKRARTICGNDSLKMYSGRNIEDGKVTYSIESARFGHCKEIVTETRRSLKLTDEHMLLTKKGGWRQVQELTPDDEVAIYPSPEVVSTVPQRRRILVNETTTKKYASPSMRIGAYIKELQSLKLLPLETTHPLLPTIARLMGSLFTDGGLYQGSNHYREMHFTLGGAQDVEAVRSDLSALGFSIHATERTTQRTIAGRAFTQHSFKVKCLSTAGWLFFRSLGVPEGNKVTQGYRLPRWLLDASPLVRREFLAGYMGGDGPRVTMRLRERGATGKESYNGLYINDIEFYKTVDHVEKGLAFANDLKQLFASLGVKIKDIFVEDTKFPRYDGTSSSVIHIKFDSSFDNVERLIHCVGYRYALDKDRASRPVGEFLRRILTQREDRIAKYKRVKQMYAKGTPLTTIAAKFGLSYDTVFGWLKQKKTPHVRHHHLKFPEWYSAVTQGLRDGLMWERVRAIQSCYLRTVQKITVTPHHNFIANGLLVHNCGPCKTMGPIIDALDKEYAGKAVKIAKMNVDENSATPSKFGVMSIPTFIIFKGGKPVEQFVGIQRKEDLKKKIDGLLK